MYFAYECPTLYTGQWVSHKLYYYDIIILIKMATHARTASKETAKYGKIIFLPK